MDQLLTSWITFVGQALLLIFDLFLVGLTFAAAAAAITEHESASDPPEDHVPSQAWMVARLGALMFGGQVLLLCCWAFLVWVGAPAKVTPFVDVAVVGGLIVIAIEAFATLVVLAIGFSQLFRGRHFAFAVNLGAVGMSVLILAAKLLGILFLGTQSF